MRHLKNSLSVFVSALLVVSLMGAPAWASDTSLDVEAQANDTELASPTTDEATIELSVEEALEFLYVESPIVSVGESENIAFGLIDESISIESATLEASRAASNQSLEWNSTKTVDNTALFTLAFASNDDIDGYLLHGVSFSAGGEKYHLNLDAASLAEASEVLEAAEEGSGETTEEIIEASTEVSAEATAVYAFEVVSAELGSALESADAIAANSGSATVAFAVDEDGTLTPTASVEEAIEVSDSAVESDAQGTTQSFSADEAIASLLGVEKAYASSNGNLVVALDPGHGGSDPGACANGLQEKDVNLKIAQYCKAALEAYNGVSVYMTRTTDEDVGLQDRVDRAVSNGADIVVSIHCNAGGGSGAEVWVPNTSSYCYQATHVVGYELGSKILNKITALGIGNRGVKTRDCTSGDEYADGSLMDYYTIISHSREHGIPGIIVEHAFIDNSGEASRLANDSFLQQLGQADAAGIAEQYGLNMVSYEDVKAYVARLYTKVLGRNYDEAGLNGWISALISGMGAGSIAQSFFNSKEFEQRGLASGEVVDIAYATFLDREADQSGREGWKAMLDSGMSSEVIVVGFGNSQEFQNLCKKWGVSAGSVSRVRNEARDVNVNVTAYVSRLYTKVLGRDCDVDGLNNWCSVILGGGGAGSVAQSFFNSKEFEQRRLSSGEVVDIAYATFLDREADQSGREGWKTMLDSGMSSEVIVVGFGNSQEFQNLCKKWGVSAGSVSRVRNEARDENGNVTAYVSRLYTKVLGRDCDVDGLNNWCSQILNGGGAGSVAVGFFNSKEFSKRGLTNDAIVETAYLTMLNRGSDEVGRKNWVTYLDNGMPVSLLIVCFANSEEFRSLCAEYGVSVGSVPYNPSDVAAYSSQNIMGVSQTTVAQMVRRYDAVGMAYPSSTYSSKGAANITEFCQILFEEAASEGVRAEVVFAQAMHETGWLQFGGDVQADQCNFCGLGATGGVPGNSFADVRTGLRAQVQHLKAYASTDSLSNPCVDPRFNYVSRGCAPLVTDLGSGKWASDPNYGSALKNQIDTLLCS